MAGKPLFECACFTRMCRNYGGVSQEAGNPEFLHICIAFPEGIPMEICGGKNQHAAPLPGQSNDTVFEKAPSYGDMEMYRSKRGAK